MHSLFGKRGVLLAGLLALAVSALAPSAAEAKPEPGAKARGFRLFARSLGAITINRVYCGLATTGEVCVDSANSSTIGGGYWPKGTANQFVFNSGLQLAGIVEDTPGNPWGGDTTGAFFFDPKGTTQHGQQVEPIYNSTNPDDVANWPQAAFVPQGDAGEDNFNPLLRGRVSASQGDVWWLSWEGNPAQNAGRLHPLGIVAEQRGLGWNFPSGNEDIVYFIYTFYNVTSLNPADYASIRPGLREIMIARGQEFHSLNNAAFGVDLPDGGYTITNLFAAFGADMDVTGDAGNNYSSVVLPFAMGHTYLADFHRPGEFTFDPGIFGAPFFESAGFVGVKYLKSPTGAGAIQLFSNTINGGAFGDAQNTKQLYRYLSGTLSPAAGDQPCNTGNPTLTRMCFVNNGNPADMRFFQSSTPLSLAPGQFGSIVVAYIFAAPYKPASYTPTPGVRVRPEQPFRMASVDSLNTVGANLVDSIAGLLSFSDGNADNIPQQNEFTVVPGSLLGKALVAQAVFDSKFLLPFAPESPEFFLVPGDNHVVVLWRASASEAIGDPFFAIAKDATIIPPGGGAPVPNPLYDPNYRQFDVEGYRIYRGRVDAPNALTLIAQFDYAGTVIEDFGGTVNPTPGCAPELDILTDCPVAYDPLEFAPGVTRTVFHEVPLVGPIAQIKSGGRVELADGNAILLSADTALTGGGAGFPVLVDNTVPFTYTDRNVRNGFRYFYSVTAFDINSFQSGPSNLESARITKSVTPVRQSSNTQLSDSFEFEFIGDDGIALSTGGPFTIDPSAGTFSGRPPVTIRAEGAIEQSVLALAPAFTGAGLAAHIDSIRIRADGEPYPDDGIASFGCQGLSNGQGLCHEYFVTYAFGGSSVQTRTVAFVPILNEVFGNAAPEETVFKPGTLPLDAAARERFGLPSTLAPLAVGVSIEVPRHGLASAGENFWGRRANGNISPGGSRWYTGANETDADPAWGTRVGSLPGVTKIFAPLSHIDTSAAATVDPYPDAVCMQVYNYAASTFARQADIEVVWGAGGTLTRVRDLTHNVNVPFKQTVQSSWGFVVDGNGNGKVDWHDIRNTEGMIQVERHLNFCGAPNAPTTLPPNGSGALLTQTAVLGPVSSATGAVAPATYATTGTGFGLYVAGHFHIFELAGGLPAAGTRWVLRGYSGPVNASAGTRATSNPEAYTYTPEPGSPAIAGLDFRFTTTGATAARLPTQVDLDLVHTVPDPYYVTSEFEATTDNKIIKFVNLPNAATIRIYSSSGVLVSVVEHSSSQLGGSADWNVRNRNNQVVASGVYFYHIEAGDARRVGRFTIVNFAQ